MRSIVYILIITGVFFQNIQDIEFNIISLNPQLPKHHINITINYLKGTAGLRETTEMIENLGIKKTHEKIVQASEILMIDELKDDADSINHKAQTKPIESF